MDEERSGSWQRGGVLELRDTADPKKNPGVLLSLYLEKTIDAAERGGGVLSFLSSF